MDVLRRLFAPAEARTANLSALEQLARDRGFATYAGVNVNEVTALTHLTVWSCVSLIADSIAMLPLHTFETPGAGDIPARVQDPDVIEQPHVEMSRFDWHVRMIWSVLMRGNAYGRILERGRGAIPVQIEPIHPDTVRIERDKSTGELVYIVGRDRERVPAADIFHVPGMVVPGSVYGLDPINYARQTIGTGLAAIEYGARFFAEGAVPPGMLSTDQKIDVDTATEYQERWEESHGNRRRRVAVLGGGLKYEAIQLSPEASQFLTTIGATKADIAGFYRCPPHMVGDVERSTSWGTGIEEQGSQFGTFTLGPWLRRFEDAWKLKLGGGLYARYNTDALLRSRLLDRFQAYTQARQGGWFNIDEVRAKEELGPLPEGKGTDYLQPLNFGAIPPGGMPPPPPPAAAVTPPPNSGA